MLRAWRDTAPELCVVEDGVGYAIAHVRGCKLYLGPIGLDVRPGNTYESIRTRTFMERYLTRVTRHLASERVPRRRRGVRAGGSGPDGRR